MKKSIAMKWADALESGEYRQTTGKLRKCGSFCCLGVLCNIHAQDNPELAKTQKRKSSYFGEDNVLPTQVMGWANIQHDEGEFYTESKDRINLVGLNDIKGYTFKEIAKVIRKHYKEL